MDITTLAAWGEFLGGIGVIASLIYLGGQIRQNSRLLKASTASANSQSVFSGQSLLVQDPDVARIHRAGLRDRESLSDEERERFDPLMSLQLDGNLQQFEFRQQGIELPLYAERNYVGLQWMAEQPGFRQWWRDWQRVYPVEFRDFVDSLIREGEAGG